ncbi:tRNA (guanine-N(1)-)-methyltransferase [Luteitalea pratensis]|uniref:tRNA (guanine-N(1)-)-methyltransferase n=2 Tax=Luteitalea pratensis TaxID=1855912 RepID=A0A143PS24_LUTPR|nr:tRNA (guanine-N(1)-)-methyltransferase [Luteitalea pratensis]
MVRAGLQEGILGRAVGNGLIDLQVHDLRDFTTDRHKVVDDTPFGGGPGMVLKAEPMFRAVEHVRDTRGTPDAVLLPSPQGRRFTQAVAGEYSRRAHLVLLCGRYEGVDERVSTALVTEEVSIGDFVLSGGELPALVIVDAVARLVPGVVGDAESVVRDSFTRGLLDHPHYTRPASLRGLDVPAVLLSGHHGEIDRWRRQQALRRTYERRPDLLADEALTDEERQWLAAWTAGERNGAQS